MSGVHTTIIRNIVEKNVIKGSGVCYCESEGLPVARCCENGDQPFVSLKDGELIYHVLPR